MPSAPLDVWNNGVTIYNDQGQGCRTHTGRAHYSINFDSTWPTGIVDRDLAAIYGVTTGRFNEAIKRNIGRFPEDFMFQLTRQEAEASRSQTAILNGSRGTNIKYLPYAFTEHGAIQAANVLRSEHAVEMGIYVVRAFVQLRNLLASNKELAQQLKKLERKVSSHDEAIVGVLKVIRQLMNPSEPASKRSIGFVELQEKKKS